MKIKELKEVKGVPYSDKDFFIRSSSNYLQSVCLKMQEKYPLLCVSYIEESKMLMRDSCQEYMEHKDVEHICEGCNTLLKNNQNYLSFSMNMRIDELLDCKLKNRSMKEKATSIVQKYYSKNGQKETKDEKQMRVFNHVKNLCKSIQVKICLKCHGLSSFDKVLADKWMKKKYEIEKIERKERREDQFSKRFITGGKRKLERKDERQNTKKFKTTTSKHSIQKETTNKPSNDTKQKKKNYSNTTTQKKDSSIVHTSAQQVKRENEKSKRNRNESKDNKPFDEKSTKQKKGKKKKKKKGKSNKTEVEKKDSSNNMVKDFLTSEIGLSFE